MNKEGRSSQMGSWVPFSAGPRMCIGYSFALQEIKVKPFIFSFIFSNLCLTVWGVLRPASTCLLAFCITFPPLSQRSYQPLQFHQTAHRLTKRLTKRPWLSLQGLHPWHVSRAPCVISRSNANCNGCSSALLKLTCTVKVH